jgi:hypothetical protein
MDKEALIELLKRAIRHGRDDAIEELAELLAKPKEKKHK